MNVYFENPGLEEEIDYALAHSLSEAENMSTPETEQEVLYRFLGSPLFGDKLGFRSFRNHEKKGSLICFHRDGLLVDYEDKVRSRLTNYVGSFLFCDMKDLSFESTNPDVADIGYFDPVTFERIGG